MGMCDEAWPCQEASVVIWEACKAGGPGHKTIRLHMEACKAGGLQSTCMCTRKLGQGQRPLKSMLVYEKKPARQEAQRTYRYARGSLAMAGGL